MTIWTVSAIYNEANCRPVHHIRGSYTTRGGALDECVRWIMDRFDSMPFLAHTMSNDMNHKLLPFFCENNDGRTLIRHGMCIKFEEWLRDELGRQGFYCASNGENEYMFSVDENDVEGGIWQTVTWGASNTEDPEFTAPHPEIFTSEETAVETFIDYVKYLYRSHHMKWSDEFVREMRKSLKENGEVKVDLNDGTCVGCVLYSGGANNVKE